jgi:hypothetical protein
MIKIQVQYIMRGEKSMRLLISDIMVETLEQAL